MCQPDQSNANLKRLCEQGGVRLMPQDEQLRDPQAETEIQPNQVIRIGKRDYFRLKN